MAAVRLHAFAACAGCPELSSLNWLQCSKSCAVSFPLAATPEMFYQIAHEQIRARTALAGAVLAVDRIGAALVALYQSRG
jgi:hypothetical protein